MNKAYSDFETKVKNFFNDLKDDAFEYVPCPICSRKQSQHMFFKDSMDVHRCSCGFVFNARQAKADVLSRFYEESEALKSWAILKEGNYEKKRQHEKFFRAIDYIVSSGIDSVLDVACGTGSFISQLKEADQSIEAMGFDTNNDAVQAAKSKGLSVVKSDLDEFLSKRDAGPYGMVTLWGILEHAKDPVRLLNGLRTKTSRIMVCVPNVNSMVVSLTWEKCFTFCPQHLWYFDLMSLMRLFDKTGWSIETGWTIESEVHPVLKAKNGYDPYKPLELWEEKRVLSVEAIESTEQLIYSQNKGYKIVAFATRTA